MGEIDWSVLGSIFELGYKIGELNGLLDVKLSGDY